jgi:hypothetical protein
MATKPDRSTSAAGLTSDKRPALLRHLWPILLGLAFGTALYAGYSLWTGQQVKVAAAAAADPDFAKPAADECAIAEAVITTFHASGDERRWLAGVGESAITLEEHSHVANLVNAPGITDEEADDLRHKAAADWRWCSGMGAFVHGLGWKPMAGAEAIPELGLGRPGLDAAGDEARMWEAFVSPEAETGAALLKGGPWLVTLHRSAGGAWRVTGTTDLPKPGH